MQSVDGNASSYLYIFVNHLLDRTWFEVSFFRRLLLFDHAFCLSKTNKINAAMASLLFWCSVGNNSVSRSPNPGFLSNDFKILGIFAICFSKWGMSLVSLLSYFCLFPSLVFLARWTLFLDFAVVVFLLLSGEYSSSELQLASFSFFGGEYPEINMKMEIWKSFQKKVSVYSNNFSKSLVVNFMYVTFLYRKYWAK